MAEFIVGVLVGFAVGYGVATERLAAYRHRARVQNIGERQLFEVLRRQNHDTH